MSRFATHDCECIYGAGCPGDTETAKLRARIATLTALLREARIYVLACACENVAFDPEDRHPDIVVDDIDAALETLG